MKMKKVVSVALSALILLPTLSALSGCGARDEIVLRVYNWEEYIDEGGEGSYIYDSLLDEGVSPSEIDAPSLIDDFTVWYEETYGKSIRVEYSTFGTNEDLYNQLKLGDAYDLVCPSDYMIMKLAAEGMLEPFDGDFFDTSDENNYYVNYLSPFIEDVFTDGTLTTADGEEHSWSEYAAGYMWGTTGLIYDPDYVNEEDLEAGWSILLNDDYLRKITLKDNVRDSYFVGLAIRYRDELLSLAEQYAEGSIAADEYNDEVTRIMNLTDEQTVSEVQQILIDVKSNIYSFETDTGKNDMVTGKIRLNFAWSGDAVYALDLAEESDRYFSYYVPKEAANLWFDGWAIPKNDARDKETKQAAQAFVNFLSMPENAVRNMYYIGYTSVMAGDEILEYVEDTYSVEEGDAEEAVGYDLSYFFGEDTVIDTYEDQLSRQLYAQYPPQEVMLRCAVMDYYGDADALINELWTKVRGESLDAWAIIVLCVAVAAIVAFIVLAKFGDKIDFFRRKPKKGYVKVAEAPLR